MKKIQVILKIGLKHGLMHVNLDLNRLYKYG